MKVSSFNHIALVTLLVFGLVTGGAISARYPGIIELQCSVNGCRFLIDGRSEP